METSRCVLRIEALLLLLALVSACLPGRTRRAAAPLAWLAAVAGIVYAGMRYWMSWPMTPTFSGSLLFPPLLVLLGAFALRGSDPGVAAAVRRWLLACGLLVVLIGVCFPKDFYLPIVKNTSVYAHGVLLFGSIGRACFFIAGGWSCAALLGHDDVMRRAFRWTAWGFACWTLSLFSGEVWSLSGWGVPMVWEDASTLTAVGTWLFYVGVIHLRLGGLGSRRARAATGVLGVALILALNGGPDMGPFVNPLPLG
ncbi:MAG: cytochrome c biogenesis protein [Candidatus Accumulibacter sp.]|nr:cytochrome c biogenesis protein [Accumulibacter sp.]